MGTFPHTDYDKTHKGNKWAVKLKDPETRQDAYKQYCDHIAAGYPKESFVLNHPTLVVTSETLDKYIKDNPDEFDSLLMKAAKSKRYQYWIEEGKKLLQGVYKGGSPVVWQTIMRNIFREIGWDKELHSNDNPELLKAHEELMKQLSALQKV